MPTICGGDGGGAPQWKGPGERLSGRLRLAARQDQAVRAVLGFDQAAS